MTVAYCSIQVNSIDCAYLSCFKAITAAAKLVEISADLTLGNVYFQTPHALQNHLNSDLAHLCEILLKCCNILNLATLLPLPDKGQLHDLRL